ncbi:MAG: hypothetical protein ACJ786_24185 [Catenulispora sp.]
MGRITRIIGTLAIAISGLALTGTSPASAATSVCVGQGTLGTAQPIYFPLVGLPAATAFSVGLSTGVCTGGNGASGTLSGPLGGANCGAAYTTSGTTNDGHSLAFVWVGSIAVLGYSPANGLGNVVGVMSLVPSNGCVGGATQFLATAVWAAS